ncbi:general amino acid permease AGP1 [Striga asiatica]|uniref:General amino acid permease AGP1 n=1 Tax=Striga asiatica TaxID=4170 RepID=A0A5A7QK45_STRAF|nr:general amino acid permease AGP1 [Striga asiatica]
MHSSALPLPNVLSPPANAKAVTGPMDTANPPPCNNDILECIQEDTSEVHPAAMELEHTEEPSKQTSQLGLTDTKQIPKAKTWKRLKTTDKSESKPQNEIQAAGFDYLTSSFKRQSSFARELTEMMSATDQTRNPGKVYANLLNFCFSFEIEWRYPGYEEEGIGEFPFEKNKFEVRKW